MLNVKFNLIKVIEDEKTRFKTQALGFMELSSIDKWCYFLLSLASSFEKIRLLIEFYVRHVKVIFFQKMRICTT